MEPYKNRVIARFALIEVRANRGPPVLILYSICFQVLTKAFLELEKTLQY